MFNHVRLYLAALMSIVLLAFSCTSNAISVSTPWSYITGSVTCSAAFGATCPANPTTMALIAANCINPSSFTNVHTVMLQGGSTYAVACRGTSSGTVYTLLSSNYIGPSCPTGGVFNTSTWVCDMPNTCTAGSYSHVNSTASSSSGGICQMTLATVVPGYCDNGGKPVCTPNSNATDYYGCPVTFEPNPLVGIGAGLSTGPAVCRYMVVETGAPAVDTAVNGANSAVAAASANSVAQASGVAASKSVTSSAVAATVPVAGADAQAAVSSAAASGYSSSVQQAVAIAAAIADMNQGTGQGGGTGNGNGTTDICADNPNVLACQDNSLKGPWDASGVPVINGTVSDASSGMAGYVASSVGAISGISFSIASAVFDKSPDSSWWSPGNTLDSSLPCGAIYGTSDNLPPVVMSVGGVDSRLPDLCATYGSVGTWQFSLATIRSLMDFMLTIFTVLYVFFVIFEGE